MKDPVRNLMRFVDDDTYMFITTPEGRHLEVRSVTYHAGKNQLEIKCGPPETDRE